MCCIFGFGPIAYVQTLSKQLLRDVGSTADYSYVRRVTLMLLQIDGVQLNNERHTRITENFRNMLSDSLHSHIDSIVRELRIDASSEQLEQIENTKQALISEFENRLISIVNRQPADTAYSTRNLNNYMDGVILQYYESTASPRRQSTLKRANSLFLRMNAMIRLVEAVIADDREITDNDIAYAASVYHLYYEVAAMWKETQTDIQKDCITSIGKYSGLSEFGNGTDMIDQTIDFIMEHYYLNRFRLMNN